MTKYTCVRLEFIRNSRFKIQSFKNHPAGAIASGGWETTRRTDFFCFLWSQYWAQSSRTHFRSAFSKKKSCVTSLQYHFIQDVSSLIPRNFKEINLEDLPCSWPDDTIDISLVGLDRVEKAWLVSNIATARSLATQYNLNENTLRKYVWHLK